MFVDDNFRQMRTYMSVSESYMSNVGSDHDIIVENEQVEPEVGVHPLHVEMLCLIERLRMFTESSSGDYALGFEAGMQRAAEMIETIIDTYEDHSIG